MTKTQKLYDAFQQYSQEFTIKKYRLIREMVDLILKEAKLEKTTYNYEVARKIIIYEMFD